MDPNVALADIRELVRLINDSTIIPENRIDEYADDLSEKFNSLDEWLTKGGFLPKEWDNANR